MEGVGAITLPFTSRLAMTDFEQIPAENWVVVQDSIQEVLDRVRPTFESEDKRRRVFEYLQRIIECSDPVIKVYFILLKLSFFSMNALIKLYFATVPLAFYCLSLKFLFL